MPRPELVSLPSVERPALDRMRQMIDEYLDANLPPVTQYPSILHEAIRYSALARAKRIRPALALTVYEALGGRDMAYALGPACALELVHTYSLIHDDLPCMDNDDLRRGQPTLHRKFGEGVAVLAGDALHDLAFQWVAVSGNCQLALELAQAIGSYGMIGGQMADMEAEGKRVDADEVSFIHKLKTAALIRCSARFGGILAGADERTLAALSVYGEKVGLAFQIVDDILDLEGDADKLGKQVGSDVKNAKATYPGAVGIASARAEASRLVDEAVTALDDMAYPTARLIELAKYITGRDE